MQVELCVALLFSPLLWSGRGIGAVAVTAGDCRGRDFFCNNYAECTQRGHFPDLPIGGSISCTEDWVTETPPFSTPDNRIFTRTVPVTREEAMTSSSSYATRNYLTLRNSREPSTTPTSSASTEEVNIMLEKKEKEEDEWSAYGPYNFPQDSPINTDGKVAEIMLPMVNVTANYGQEASFTCAASGNPSPLVTITRREQASALSFVRPAFPYARNNIVRTIEASLTLGNVAEDDEGWYVCMACNYYGPCEASEAYLTVVQLPSTAPQTISPTRQMFTTPEDPDPTYNGEVTTGEEVRELTTVTPTREEGITMVTPTQGEITIGTREEGEVTTVTPTRDSNPETSGTPTSPDYKTTSQLEEEEEDRTSKPDYLKTVSTDGRGFVTGGTTAYPVFDDIEEVPMSTCQIFGDMSFLSFDQKKLSVRAGTCDYMLAADCRRGDWFVYGRTRPCGLTGSECLEGVTVYVSGHSGFELMRGWLINLNGVKISPKNHIGQEILVDETDSRIRALFDGATLEVTVKLNDDDELVLRWDGYTSLTVQSPLSAVTCGLCGNNDGDPDNDMEMRVGGSTSDVGAFVDSWRIDHPSFECRSVEETSATVEEPCNSTVLLAECQQTFNIGNFDVCDGHDKTPFIEACVSAQCEEILTSEELPPRCVLAQAYALRCSDPFWYPGGRTVEAGDWSVSGWEESAECPSSEERFQTVLDVGCPQPSLEEEQANIIVIK